MRGDVEEVLGILLESARLVEAPLAVVHGRRCAAHRLLQEIVVGSAHVGLVNVAEGARVRRRAARVAADVANFVNVEDEENLHLDREDLGVVLERHRRPKLVKAGEVAAGVQVAYAHGGARIRARAGGAEDPYGGRRDGRDGVAHHELVDAEPLGANVETTRPGHSPRAARPVFRNVPDDDHVALVELDELRLQRLEDDLGDVGKVVRRVPELGEVVALFAGVWVRVVAIDGAAARVAAAAVDADLLNALLLELAADGDELVAFERSLDDVGDAGAALRSAHHRLKAILLRAGELYIKVFVVRAEVLREVSRIGIDGDVILSKTIALVP
mmetsp:Transcript_27486/g.98106  ORF Transcript_27486/g.98106 Transcript_27486/m.98106 type:complete len:329 (+) Transcript_27486:1316-2302(+)